MKHIIISIAVLGAFVFGCCGHKQVIKDNQAEKSKIEAEKAQNEMDKEKTKSLNE